MNYKIYGYLDEYDDEELYPGHIVYTVVPKQRLKREVTWDKGHIVNICYHGSYDGTTYSDPVVEEVIGYTYDVFGVPLTQSKLIFFYYDDGTKDPNFKDWSKPYTSAEGQAVNRRRRRNIINHLQEPIIGLIMATESIDASTAAPIGIAFLADYELDITMWIDNPGAYTLQDALNAEVSGTTAHQFLFNDIGDGTTIKDYILDAINY